MLFFDLPLSPFLQKRLQRSMARSEAAQPARPIMPAAAIHFARKSLLPIFKNIPCIFPS
jgi:hypothetical protein